MALALRALLASLAIGQVAGAAAQGDPPQALSAADIMQVIGDHKSELARCNEEHAGASVHDLMLHFKIRPDGRTTDVRFRGHPDNRPLANCVESLIRHTHFGPYLGPPMPPVDFPISFGPVESRARARPAKERAPNKRDVTAAIVAHKAEFLRCKTDHPGGHGTTVVFHWTVGLDGSLSDVHRKGGDIDDNPAFVDCLEEHVRSLHFRPYDAPKLAEFDFPFQR